MGEVLPAPRPDLVINFDILLEQVVLSFDENLLTHLVLNSCARNTHMVQIHYLAILRLLSNDKTNMLATKQSQPLDRIANTSHSKAAPISFRH